MKKLFALSLILLFTVTVLCACGSSFVQKMPIVGDDFLPPTISPYQSQTLPNKNTKTFVVYVCGAVQNEGYYVVEQGTTIASAIARAGILPQTYFPTDSMIFVQNNCQIVVCYHQDGATYDCINLNGVYIQHNLPAPNIAQSVVEKLHNYYVQNGKISNKQILKQILTDQEYQQNHYKFFVKEGDYATSN